LNFHQKILLSRCFTQTKLNLQECSIKKTFTPGKFWNIVVKSREFNGNSGKIWWKSGKTTGN